MCGGFKPSRKWLRSKEDQIAREMSRLASLQQGQEYIWPLSGGVEKHVFAGHARNETLDKVWAKHIKEHVTIEAESFAERDTKHKTYEFKHFLVPEKKGIHAIITNNNELRIVTKAAEGDCLDCHHREPNTRDLV